MLGNWNYTNYTKAIVPLALAVGALLVSWVDAGELNKAELQNVIWLGIAALLVFLAPNVPSTAVEKGVDLPNDPNRRQEPPKQTGDPNAAPYPAPGPRGPLAETPEEKPPTVTQPQRRRRRTPKAPPE